MATVSLLGATGRTGRPLLDRLLEKGHEVRVLVRSEQHGLPDHPHLTILKGDATDADDLERVIEGTTAVFSCLGTDQKQILSVAVPHLIIKMKEQQIERIVFVGTAGILDASEEPGKYRFQSSESRRRSTIAAEDHLKAYLTLKDADVDYTIICPTQLVEEDAIEDVLIESNRFTHETGPIPRINVARFAYEVYDEGLFHRERVGIASRG
ncbi:NAD(P)-dependent oxidoreductase [Exiguobacterium artemiae]|uniref:NAD(P)-dependent oxidoreductase n=1 Tax=Exiguobacterium artemiae TaxID=340145 RepID=UPI00047B1152|nr:NAD(P)-binding oxidoreductase [Exiguobacterium sibiricum]